MGYISEPHSIRFTCHMECPAFELVEMLKENCNEGGNVFSCVLSVVLSKLLSYYLNEIQETYHALAKFCVGEANTNRLINEEDVCIRVPGLGMEFRRIRIC